MESNQKDAAPSLILYNGAAAVALYDDHIRVNGRALALPPGQRRLLWALVLWALAFRHQKMPAQKVQEAVSGRSLTRNALSVQMSHLWSALRQAHIDAPGIVRSQYGFYWIPRHCFGTRAVEVGVLHRFQIGEAEVILDESRELTVNDTSVAATESELKYFTLLAERAGTVCDKLLTLKTLYGEPKNWPEYKIIDVVICNLRKKLAAIHPDAEQLIQTSWGRGYYIASAPNAAATSSTARSGETRARVYTYLGRDVCLDDLPPPGARWVIARKHLVVGLLHHEAITLPELLERYPGLTAEEIEGWRILLNRGGLAKLRVTRLAA